MIPGRNDEHEKEERMRYLYRNVWSGATFVVIGEEGAARMTALPSWQREE